MKRILLLSGAVAVAASLTVAVPVFASTDNSDHKIGICHATGSKTNPYVFINVDKHAADAHAKHQDGRDVIGAKSIKDCPQGSVLSTSTSKPAATPAPGKGAVEPQATELPKTGASDGLSALIGIPAMVLAGRAYLRSRLG